MNSLIATVIKQKKNFRLISAALLVAGAAGGWASSTALTRAATVDGLSAFGMRRNEAIKSSEDLKPSLIGSYAVSGTDSDGRPYGGSSILDITLAPSGALELEWTNSKQVGVGQIVGNILAVACWKNGRTAILLMTINPDGSLSGKWSRRTDRGYKGTETWTKS